MPGSSTSRWTRTQRGLSEEDPLRGRILFWQLPPRRHPSQPHRKIPGRSNGAEPRRQREHTRGPCSPLSRARTPSAPCAAPSPRVGDQINGPLCSTGRGWGQGELTQARCTHRGKLRVTRIASRHAPRHPQDIITSVQSVLRRPGRAEQDLNVSAHEACVAHNGGTRGAPTRGPLGASGCTSGCGNRPRCRGGRPRRNTPRPERSRRCARRRRFGRLWREPADPVAVALRRWGACLAADAGTVAQGVDGARRLSAARQRAEEPRSRRLDAGPPGPPDVVAPAAFDCVV